MDTRTLVKTDEEITVMRQGCQILASVVESLAPLVIVGASGADIDAFAEAEIRKAGCVPSFKGYGAGGDIPFPATICFSRNQEIVHGIPSDEKIENGDLVKIDIGLIYKGYHADMARTFVVEGASQEARDLARVTEKAFHAGVATIRNGSTLNAYAHSVQDYVESRSYGVVRNLVGHGIGKELHMPPQIPNYVGKEFDNFTFRTGMTVALEPMVNIGSPDTKLAEDEWTFETFDGSLSAHWENTILVTDDGVEILTAMS